MISVFPNSNRDQAMDGEVQQAAERQARKRASVQTLPFPDLTEDCRKKIPDTLDYPPEGSPKSERG